MPLPHRGRVREASAEPVLWISARRDRGLWTSGPRRQSETRLDSGTAPAAPSVLARALLDARPDRATFKVARSHRAMGWVLARSEQLSKLLTAGKHPIAPRTGTCPGLVGVIGRWSVIAQPCARRAPAVQGRSDPSQAAMSRSAAATTSDGARLAASDPAPTTPARRRRTRGPPAPSRTGRPGASRRSAGRRRRAPPAPRHPPGCAAAPPPPRRRRPATRSTAGTPRAPRPRAPPARAPAGPPPSAPRGPSRSGAIASRVSATADAPSSSPACGTSISPARRAMAKACANSSVTPRRSSFDSPNPTTSPGPEPACRAASRASVFASSGCRIRLAATMTPTCAAPGSADAARASSSTISRAGVMPPTNGAYEVGSTWISSHRDPSAPSSSAASRTIRRMSASPRTQARAASYSRWNRNQPRASAVSNRGGQSVVSDDGSRMPCCAARSRTVATRIEPVKCRWRWALGRSVTDRWRSAAASLTRRRSPRRTAPR